MLYSVSPFCTVYVSWVGADGLVLAVGVYGTFLYSKIDLITASASSL